MELLIIYTNIRWVTFTFFLFKSWTSTMNSISKTQLRFWSELKKLN